MIERYDAIVVGAGQAGPALAARLGAEGLATALIERQLLGGTCVNNGCIPTKTLVGSARALHMARRGAEYGFDAGEVKVDMKAVKARKDGVVRHSSEGLAAWIAGMQNVTLIWGHARFTAPRTLEVSGKSGQTRSLQADRIFLNVGGRAVVPDIPGIDDVPYLTNSSIMDVDELPEHLVIVGGSYIGLEFAQMYRRFGAQVTVIEKFPKLLPREDEDVVAEIRAILEREGVAIHTGAETLLVRSERGRVIAEFGGQVVEGSHLLLAVGRIPNTDNLGLKEGGIAANARGFVTVDDQCRTSAEGVWALGDANGKGAFTHTSWNDYEIVAANLFDKDPRKISDRVPCYALFIDPPLGRVGMNEAEAKKSGRKLLGAKMLMTRVGRAREMGETQGFMKVLVDAESKELLGAAILGLNGDEIVHSLLDVMYAKKPYTTISRAVHIHPTVTELVPTLLQNLRPVN
ncbi:MAG TPA: FAD-containing oxidoreductase [Burkholderiales bacterium]|nr:FAD-containing oxidoreductase [Burkholderiales bacterium]